MHMSVALIPYPPGRPRRFRWTGGEFDRAVEMGIFDGQRVELIDGEILEAPPMNDPHAQAIQLAPYALIEVFPPTTETIRVQCPMRLGEARPLPDFAVIAGTPRQITSHPTTALLVIEVADTTLEFDRVDKGRLYAASGITDYWIVNINERCVEVYRQPTSDASAVAHYASLRTFGETEAISPFAKPGAVIRVADLLPSFASNASDVK
jgi:Uma2 family endonuclease